MNGINRLLRSTLHVNDEIIKEVENQLIKFVFSKNKELLSLGEYSDKIYFLESGLIREYYYLSDKNEDITTQIVCENTFFYSTLAYLSGKPSERIVETLEPTVGYSIRKSDLDELINRFPVLGIFIKTMMESTLIDTEKRFEILRCKTPTQKLDAYEKLHPMLSNRIPSTMIASYLGIAPQTLSTARSNRARNSS